MKADGVDVVSFAAGEPDFSTPELISNAAIDAIRAGFTRYTPSAGAKDLKEAIVAKLARENKLTVTPEQVIVSCGAKHSVYNTMQVLVNPGDEVILLAPYWMTYAEQIRLAGGIPVVVNTDPKAGFVPTKAQVEAQITPKTRAIILNTPTNPTGAMLPKSALVEIAELAEKHDFWIVADEIYELLVYGGEEHHSIATLNPEVAARTVTIGGCSKSYAMTGWRIGFAAAPPSVAKAMSNFQDQVTSNPTSFAQKGAVAAFGLPASAVEAMRAEFEARRDLIVQLLGQLPRVETPLPKGAFYAFPDFSSYLGSQIPDDLALSEYLLKEAQVATVPGSVFEGRGHLRLSYACSRVDIERGIARIREALLKIAA